MKIRDIIGFVFLLSLPSVFAADNVGQTIGKTMYKIFGWIFVDVSGKLGSAVVQFAMKFMVWILLFAIFFFGVRKVFPDKKNIQVTVAIVLSLMAVLLIPSSVLINIMRTYSGIAVIFVFVIPIAGLLYLNKYAFPGKDRVHCVMKAITAYLMGLVFHNMIGLETELGFKNLDAWIGFGEAVAMIAFIVYLVCAIFGKGEGGSEGGEGGGGEGGEGEAEGGGQGGGGAAAPGGELPGTPNQVRAPVGSGAPEITNVDTRTGQVQGRVR